MYILLIYTFMLLKLSVIIKYIYLLIYLNYIELDTCNPDYLMNFNTVSCTD